MSSPVFIVLPREMMRDRTHWGRGDGFFMMDAWEEIADAFREAFDYHGDVCWLLPDFLAFCAAESGANGASIVAS